MNHPRIQRR